jgi:hypothetical protein
LPCGTTDVDPEGHLQQGALAMAEAYEMTHQKEDLTLLSVRSAFDHLQSTINRALQRIERQKQLNNTELFAEIKERRKLAKVLMLDRRIIHLYQALSAKPSLKVERGESLIHCELGASVITHEGSSQVLTFHLNETVYQMRVVDNGGACISYYGETFKSSHLSLFSSVGEELLTLHLTLQGESDVDDISESQIMTFVPGRWIYDIIHAYETLVTSESLNAINQSYSSEKLEQLKRRFGIE